MPHARHSPESSSSESISCDRAKPQKWGGNGQEGSAGSGGGQSSTANVTQQELGAEPWLCAQLCSAQGQAKSQALLPVIYLEHQCQSHTAPHQAQSLRSHPAARANVSTGYQVLQTSQLWLHLFLGWEQKVTLVSGKPYQYLLFAFILTR